MHITKVELKNFKRFTDLTIDGIPADAKLVLLIGSNGSGKSSVFDAFEVFNRFAHNEGFYSHAYGTFGPYHYKLYHQQGQHIHDKVITSIELAEGSSKYSISSDTNETSINLPQQSFYGRTSLRQIPRLTRTQFGQGTDSDPEKDSDRPQFYIDRDNRFENDIERISKQIVREIFRNQASAKEIRDKYIEPINQALGRIFDGQQKTVLSLVEVIPPGEGQTAQINFRKGESEIHYDFLSAGEKEVFNVLFNLLVRRDQYTDTIYFFDELDLHLNTKLQFNLLKEITQNWIPENCQLWTASHSLGFIDYARKYDKGVIVDFDDLDFDLPQTLFPQPKEQLDVYDIAVPKEMLFEIMKDKRVVVCENQNDEYYNLLALPNTIFVGMKDNRSVFLQVKNDPRYHSIRDRDFLSDTEIDRIESAYPNHHILRYYNFENYLYHPDNLAELNPTGFHRETYIAAITKYKQERYDYTSPTLISSRQTYEEFKTDEKLKDKNTDSIVDDFKSAEFERFYKYLNMKNQHEKIDPALGKISQKRLVQTAWFRQQIEAILNR